METTTPPDMETCGACGAGFPDIAQVFSHPCPRPDRAPRPGHRRESLAQLPQGDGSFTGGSGSATGATDKQLAFLARLAGERGVEVPSVATKVQASAAIEALLTQPKVQSPSSSSDNSDIRANRYAGRCGSCRVEVAADTGRIAKVDGRWVTYHLEGACPTAPAPSAPAHRRVDEEGFYLNPDTGEVYKVQVAHHGSGALYAKRLELPKDGAERGSWVYEARLRLRIDPAWKLTLEAAQEWGRLYGYCCRCGAILTDEASIARGLGPICAGKFDA